MAFKDLEKNFKVYELRFDPIAIKFKTVTEKLLPCLITLVMGFGSGATLI